LKERRNEPPLADKIVTLTMSEKDMRMAAFALERQADLCQISNNEFAASAYRRMAQSIYAAISAPEGAAID
jgi:hypothetical protein